MPTLVIGKKKLESLRKMPTIETIVRKSKDGHYIIHKTVITSIRPVEYYMAVLETDLDSEEEIVVEEEHLEV
jgi:hypothetical protein